MSTQMISCRTFAAALPVAGGGAVAATAALARTPRGSGTGEGDDPVFAAIDAFRTAQTAVRELADEGNRLKNTLDWDSRRSGRFGGELNIDSEDDQAWIDFQRRLTPALVAEEEAAIRLCATQPTTTAGAAAVLRHVAAFRSAGWDWPTSYLECDAIVDERVRTTPQHCYEASLARTLSDALAATAAGPAAAEATGRRPDPI